MLLSSTNHLICYFSFLHVIFMIITARQIHIIIRDNVTQACPSRKSAFQKSLLTKIAKFLLCYYVAEKILNMFQHSELIDRKTISVQFELMPLAGDADQLLITGQNGNRQTITFPGCFRARLNFQLKKLINNPYIESFIQFGTNIPCKVEEDEVTSNVKRICTNITEKNWCPQSDNQKLRSMLNGKSTCRFCNLCQPLKSFDKDLESYIQSEGPDHCNSTSLYKTFILKICTPSSQQLREKNLHYNGRSEEYWNYLKQGVLTAVVHIMDRPHVRATSLRQCQRLCRTYENYPTISESYRATLHQTIEELCVPADSYVACIYHTLRFDVINS
uniref:Bm3040, isoform c n=1 Tax=Brugia malayi TaxID=6279 RepID=A0A8L7T0V1_BRUMA